jgi:hypothetical protein
VLGDAVVDVIRAGTPNEASMLLDGLTELGLHELRGRIGGTHLDLELREFSSVGLLKVPYGT